MTLRLVPPAAPRASRTKTLAFAAFRRVRSAQRCLAQIPVAVTAVVQDVRDAWRESGRGVPNA